MSNVLIRLSSLEQIVLKLLIASGGELHGWQMIKDSDGRLKTGTIYVTLGRMEAKGYISSRKEERKQVGERGLPRRLYEPTALGKRVLAAWEMLPVGNVAIGEVGT